MDKLPAHKPQLAILLQVVLARPRLPLIHSVLKVSIATKMEQANMKSLVQLVLTNPTQVLQILPLQTA
jgi:hypothetical protein